jgi:hypothetical protein
VPRFPFDPLDIELHERQWEVFQSKARFRILVAGRRFGKTYLALVEMLLATQGGNKLIWYVGPNDQQSKRIAWERLKAITRHSWAKRPNETELRIDLTCGSTLVVSGAFRPDSLRGEGLDFLVIDEFASLKPEAWTEVFRPALADRKGRALFIGTPLGRNHFYDQFEYAKTDPDWETFQFTTAQGGLVDEAELRSAARELDPESYRQEFEAEFTSVGRHRAYYAFEREEHTQPLNFEPLYPLVWSLDFNVNPMCMLLMQRIGEVVNVLEELVIQPDANTEAACELFQQSATRYFGRVPFYQRPLTVEVYGDASGNHRRTAGVATDWMIVRQFFARWTHQYSASFRTVSANPAVRDRVNCVNSRLRNNQGESRLLIDPRCKELIRDLEQVSWAVDTYGAATSDLDKSDRARTHASDALGYYLSQAFTMRPKVGEQSRPLLGGDWLRRP